MQNREIERVSDYIDVVKNLTKNQTAIAREQSDLLSYLREKKNSNSSLSNYYQALFKEKDDMLKAIQEIQPVDLWGFNDKKETQIPQYKFYYRGHYKSSYELMPSAFRGDNWDKEDYFYHEIMVHCPQHFQYDSHLDKLVTMQHYDCPTRLLDVTSNPLVALYFACKNYGCKKCETSDEGEVLIFPVISRDVVYSDSDRALMLSCLPRFTAKDKGTLFDITLKSLSDGKFKQVSGGSRYADSIVERFFHEITTELPSFKREIKPLDLLHPLFVQPNKTNGRILKQDGAFIINGLSANGHEAKEKLKALTHASITIHNQKGILEELKSLGINEASLFPEVDKVAQYLKDCV